MAIVGTAYVRLRVIGDKLKGDITTATRKAVNDSAPDLNRSGEDAGGEVGKGLGKGVERDARTEVERIGDDIGNTLGRAMGNSLGRSLRNRIGGAIRNGLNSGRAELNRAQNFFRPVSDKFEQFFGEKSKQFEGLFSKAMVSGISLAAIAAPSALAFLGAAITAVAATAVTAISALGPAAVGAGLVAVAAFSSIKIATGLIGLAMKQQTPELDDFHKRLEAFKTTIALPVQYGLLPSFNAAMRISAPLIRSLQTDLTAFGIAAGGVVLELADAFRQPQQIMAVHTILNNITGAITLATPGIVGLGVAFATLLAHLGPITSFLGQLIGDIGSWVNATVQGAAASGQLDAFITRMFDSLRYFVGILVDFGIGIWNVFSAAHAASGGMLQTLQANAQAFKEWTGDPANRDRMINFFERMRVITGEVLGVLKDLAGATLRGMDSTNVGKFSAALGTIVDIGKSVGGVFEQIRTASGDKLQEMFKNLGDMLVQLANSGVIGTVATALSNLFLVISQLLQIPGIGQLLAFGAGLFAIFKTISLLWTVLGPIVEILWTLIEVVGGALVAAFGWIPVVIGLVVVALIWFFTQTKIGREIIAAVWDFIKNAISGAVDGIVAAFHWVVQALTEAWTWITAIAQGIWIALSSAFQSVVGAVSTAWNTVVTVITTAMSVVWGIITGVWNAIWGFIQPILNGIWNVVQTVFGGIVTAVQWYLNFLLAIFNFVFPIMALPIRVLYGVIIWIWDQIVAGTTWAFNFIHDLIITVWNAIWGFIQPILQTIADFFTMIWNVVSTVVMVALNYVWGVITSVWNTIWGFISWIVGLIVGWIVDRWNEAVAAVIRSVTNIWNWIVSIWNAIWGFLQPIIAAIVGFVVERWNNLVNNIQTALSIVWTVITSVWNQVIGFLRNAMNIIGGVISTAWDAIGSAGHGVLDALKSAVNTVIDAINTVIGGINWAINAANNLPGPDIPTIPKIPHLARGGVVSPTGGGTLAMIAEAGRPERVEPLDASGLSTRDRAVINFLAGGNGPQVPNITVLLGTREIEDIIDVHVEDREGGLASRIKTGTKG